MHQDAIIFSDEKCLYLNNVDLYKFCESVFALCLIFGEEYILHISYLTCVCFILINKKQVDILIFNIKFS